MDIFGPRNGSPGNSSVPAYSTPGPFGNGSSGAAVQPINGVAADQAGSDDGIGGVWTTAQQYMGGQAGRTAPASVPTDQLPATFPQGGAQPIGYLNGASPSATFDPAPAFVPLPRPRPPQAPAAAWPSAQVAPLQHLPQTGSAAPEHQDWHDAGDWPREGLPNWTQPQRPTEDSFPAIPNGGRGSAGSLPPAQQRLGPQLALPVENLTTRTLRMKGVPEADIAAAIGDPAKMQDLLNQYYGRRPIAPSTDSWAAYNRATQGGPVDQPDQASTPATATPKNYIPFGWAGLPALLR
jgi:hypothetical protein